MDAIEPENVALLIYMIALPTYHFPSHGAHLEFCLSWSSCGTEHVCFPT